MADLTGSSLLSAQRAREPPDNWRPSAGAESPRASDGSKHQVRVQTEFSRGFGDWLIAGRMVTR